MHFALRGSRALGALHGPLIQSDQFKLRRSNRCTIGTLCFPRFLKVCQFGFFHDESFDFSLGLYLIAKRSLVAFARSEVPGSVHMEYPIRAAEVAFFFVVVLSHGTL